MNLDTVNLDALYLAKLIFGKYFCHFDSNRVAASLKLQLYFDANCVPVSESVNIEHHLHSVSISFMITTINHDIFICQSLLANSGEKHPGTRKCFMTYDEALALPYKMLLA